MKRLGLGFSSCALFLSFEDLVVVSTGCGANLRGGGEDMLAVDGSRATSPNCIVVMSVHARTRVVGKTE